MCLRACVIEHALKGMRAGKPEVVVGWLCSLFLWDVVSRGVHLFCHAEESGSPETLMSLPPQFWDSRLAPQDQAFSHGTGDQNLGSSHLQSKQCGD